MYMYTKGFTGSNSCKERDPPTVRWSKQWYVRKLSTIPGEMRSHSFPQRRDVPVMWDLKRDIRREADAEPVVLFDGELRAGRFFVENLHRYVKGEPLEKVVDKQKGY